MTINPSPPATLPNTVQTTFPSNSSTFVPTFTNNQYPIPPPPLSSAQQQPPTNPGPTDKFPSAIPPPIMPPFNFGMQNPQQQQQQYFQPVPPSVFTDSQQQQQQQQFPFQFNPTGNTYSNTLNTFSAPPPPSSVQQASHVSQFTNDHHGHSHDHDGSGHGHSHDHSGDHGHSHDH